MKIWDVQIEKLAVIRMTKDKIPKAVETRQRYVPQLPGCPEAPATKYTSSNLGRIRLAFSLSFADTIGQYWQLSPVFSDEIVSDKEKKNIEIVQLNPAEVSMKGGTKFVIYTDKPTTGIKKSDVVVKFHSTGNHSDGTFCLKQVKLDEMKKHLLIVTAPDMRQATTNDRFKCSVAVHSNGFASSSLGIIFVRELSTANPGVRNRLKRSRNN